MMIFSRMARATCNTIPSVVIILFLFVQASWQQKDPVSDFCRRFAHQSTVIDRKLYLDGGFVNWNPIAQNPANYTNTWLLYEDLDVINNGQPQLYANLSKNASIPDVSGGILWSDTINKRFYLFGGEYTGIQPDTLKLFSYDVINNQCDNFGQPSMPINRVSWGAGVSISERGEGYYYGGWLSNAAVPGYTGQRVATNGLVKYNMDTNIWTNNTGPDSVPRAEGVMVYIPSSDRGMLIYFGGISAPYGNDTMVGMPMSTILIYDIGGGQWYNQTATGDVPEMRRRFCAGATWSSDQSSYNIYLYGGAGVPPNNIGFDDVYILSLPSFTWIKWYPTTPGLGSPHGQLTCNVVNGAQMLIIGGTFPLSDQCDAANVYGTHNLNLGKQNVDNAMWYQFLPNLTTYQVPTEITAKIGGNAFGGAQVTTPAAGWANRDLPVLFPRTAAVSVRTATRTIPTSTGAPVSGPKLSTGAIAGIAVGGAVALVALLGCCCVFIRRHRRANRRSPATYTGSMVQSSGYDPSYPPHTAHSGSFSYVNGLPFSQNQSPIQYISPPLQPVELATGSGYSSPNAPSSPRNAPAPYQPMGSYPPSQRPLTPPRRMPTLRDQYGHPKVDPSQIVVGSRDWPVERVAAGGYVATGEGPGYVERHASPQPSTVTRSPGDDEGWAELSARESMSPGHAGLLAQGGGSPGYSAHELHGHDDGQRMGPAPEYESVVGARPVTGNENRGGGRPLMRYTLQD